MTEAEWLVCEDPALMLPMVNGSAVNGINVGDRKLKLWVEACRSIYWSSVGYNTKDLDSPTGLRVAVVYWAGRNADAYVPPPMRAGFLRDIVGNPFAPLTLHPKCRRCGGSGEVEVCEGAFPDGQCGRCNGRGLEKTRPWLTPTVLSIAQSIYDSRNFAEMPVLADALVDAGCPEDEPCPKSRPDADMQDLVQHKMNMMWSCKLCKGTGRILHPLIAHLRTPDVHVRGCWVLDLLLDKK